jgi:GNAT superfamily N-acetyltransferase
MSETIIKLERSHIPAGIRLKEAAAWNQTEQDWARLLEMEPDGCFGLLCDGEVVATTTAVCFGQKLAWIGMVLTDPAYRGRGFARRLMEHALEFLERRGVEWLKLDATDMGRPLYLKLGFEDEALVERWVAPASAVAQASAPARMSTFELDGSLDLEAFGAGRTAILQSLAAEEAASVAGAGYGMGRPGSKAAYFGPCVCRSSEAARQLLQWFLSRHHGENVAWDLLPDNREALRLAQEFGFERRRQLVRMVLRGSAATGSFLHNDSYVYAIAGFEYG